MLSIPRRPVRGMAGVTWRSEQEASGLAGPGLHARYTRHGLNTRHSRSSLLRHGLGAGLDARCVFERSYGAAGDAVASIRDASAQASILHRAWMTL
jgi:hypothetical protein